jgi:glycosyltransferase involved in cell wall biosynthesis
VALARHADILHAQAFQSVPPLMVARARTGAPLVATYHTSHFLRLAAKRVWRPLLGRLVAAGEHNLAASVEIARVAEGLAPGHAVEPLTNGVDTDLFRRVEPSLPVPEGGRRRVIVPRRLFEKNGVEFFVRALPRIAERVDVEAVLVGDGPERERLERLAAELGVTDRIRFLGARPNADMPGLLASGELAIFPSLMEATSVAALECMACELPVAASNVGGLPEIVDAKVGALFQPADPEDLARVVVALLSRTDLPDLGGRARRRVVERWSNERLADRHLEIYEELVRRRGRPKPTIDVHTPRQSHGEKR